MSKTKYRFTYDEVRVIVKENLGDAVEAGVDGVDSVRQFVFDSGEDAIHAIAHGLGRLGTTISVTLASVKKIKEQNIELRKKLEKLEMDESYKQKIIIKLNADIEELKRQLQEAEAKGEEHAEIIKELAETIDELIATRGMVETKKVS